MHNDSLKSHIEHLEESHSYLDHKLIQMEKQRQYDSTEARDLRKKKLLIKDELYWCRQKLNKIL